MTFVSVRSARNMAALSLTAAAVVLALPATAQTSSSGASTSMSTPRAQFGSSGYLGLNLGRSRFDTNCGNGVFGCDNSDRALHLYAGSMFSDYFGLELGYLNFGDMARGGGETKAQGLNLSLVGKVPVATALGLYGKIGTTYGRTETSAVAGSGVVAGSDNGFGLSYGLGVSYDFSPRVSAVLGWDSHDLRFAGTGRDAVRTTTLGVQFRY